jgi:hypothetical protein
LSLICCSTSTFHPMLLNTPTISPSSVSPSIHLGMLPSSGSFFIHIHLHCCRDNINGTCHLATTLPGRLWNKEPITSSKLLVLQFPPKTREHY